MFRTMRITLITSAAMIVGACTTAPAERVSVEQKLGEKDYRIVEEIDRIQDYRIHGWNYIDDHHVIFQGGPSDYYLLTFNQPCLNLRGASTIAFSTTLGRVTTFDKVLVRDRTGLPPEECLIREMHRLQKLS